LEDPTRVEFWLDPIERGTRLTLMHTGDTPEHDRANVLRWPVKLAELRSLLEKAD
jgi:hypothetical protein